MEIYGRIAFVVRWPLVVFLVLASKRLHRCPRVDEAAIHGEVLVARQSSALGLGHHRHEELPSDIVLKQPLTILGERAVIERSILDTHVQKPSEEQVIVELLAEQSLAAHGVESHQQRGFEQLFGRDTRAPTLAVHLSQRRRKRLQGSVSHVLHSPKWMVLRHSITRGPQAE